MNRGDFQSEIELEKLMSDSLYLDNQAHAVVIRMRDIDSGTKSQLRPSLTGGGSPGSSLVSMIVPV